jgi:hypothetical protein
MPWYAELFFGHTPVTDPTMDVEIADATQGVRLWQTRVDRGPMAGHIQAA